MVSEPTVLIVGAGGSIPYGYPSGQELADELIVGLMHPGSDLGRRLLEMHQDADHMLAFARQLRASAKYSVDAFLEKHPEFLKLGKLAIATALIPKEASEGRHVVQDGDWYRYLSNRIAGNIDSEKTEPLGIITFNYDRSLENFLYVSLTTSFNVKPEKAADFLGRLEILHVHGSLCPLPWQRKEGEVSRIYGGERQNMMVEKAADYIRIIHEHEDSDPVFVRARAMLSKARRVLFLGFGYHRTNVRRLLGGNWHNLLFQRRSNAIRGSGFGFTPSEINEIRQLFGGKIEITPGECLDVLRNNVDMIS